MEKQEKDFEKIEIDGEIFYVEKNAQQMYGKLTKEQFKEKLLEERAKKRKEINKKAFEQWQTEQDNENKRLNKKSTGKTTGTSRKEKNTLIARFENFFSAKTIKFVNIGNTETAINYGGKHYTIKVTKKTKPLTAFVDVKASTIDKEKQKIYTILLEVIEEQTAMIKNDLYVRTESGDFLVKLTKKKDGVEGL